MTLTIAVLGTGILGLYAPTFDKKLPRLLKRDYQRPSFSSRHLLKDVRLVLHQAAALGLETKALDGMPLLLEEGMARGLGRARLLSAARGRQSFGTAFTAIVTKYDCVARC